ncbi:hypothetical protein [Priestia megaterium]|uniref:hypothetical protein n=1 Tax=Priestia megaterium TaxID=1404 RepID=UPI001126C1D0|nr:hypothetical protein [Priestia megaterium]TPF18112.1 hypothetical protein CBE78_02460 [Priestia megaterium]TPF22219.1 hypothetical protein CBE79_04965 [Priestia megaterium]
MDANENAKKHYLHQIDKLMELMMHFMQHEKLSETSEAYTRDIINNTYALMITPEEELPIFKEDEETVH